MRIFCLLFYDPGSQNIMMSPEMKGDADYRILQRKEKVFRTFAASVLSGSIILSLHKDRESSEIDFLQIPPTHVSTIESNNKLTVPEIQGPIAPTEQEMMENISVLFERAAKVEKAKIDEDPIDKVVVKDIIPYKDGHVAAASAGLTSDNVWDVLAHCESTDDWHINTGNGYYGGLQMDMDFWRSYGGLEFAERPDLATKEQQITVAERARDSGRGYGPWPTCGPNNGLGGS